LENLGLFSGGNANTGIRNAEVDDDPTFFARLFGSLDDNLAPRGALYGIPYQVQNDLAESGGIAHEKIRQVVINTVSEFESFLIGTNT
jgi:hypothetical protein